MQDLHDTGAYEIERVVFGKIIGLSFFWVSSVYHHEQDYRVHRKSMRVDSQDAHEDDHHKVVLKIVQGYDDEGDD